MLIMHFKKKMLKVNVMSSLRKGKLTVFSKSLNYHLILPFEAVNLFFLSNQRKHFIKIVWQKRFLKTLRNKNVILLQCNKCYLK